MSRQKAENKLVAVVPTSADLRAQQAAEQTKLETRRTALKDEQDAQTKLEAELSTLVLAEADGDQVAAQRVREIEGELTSSAVRVKKAALLVEQTEQRVKDLGREAGRTRMSELVEQRDAKARELADRAPDIDAAINTLNSLIRSALSTAMDAHKLEGEILGSDRGQRFPRVADFFVLALHNKLTGISRSIPYTSGRDAYGGRDVTFTALVNGLARGVLGVQANDIAQETKADVA